MIATSRLDLVAPTPDTVRAALDGAPALAASLGVEVPPTWPPDYLDADALEFVLGRLVDHPAEADWWLYFVILRSREGNGRSVIGSAGYKGPPTADGIVEIGYGIVSDQRRKGYATEAALGLVAHAFGLPQVRAVIAHTLPELTPSIGVLGKCGFRFVGEGTEPGAIQFRLDRPPVDRA
jgi:ribosomal-protein-alanine N-acetyltransferase